MPAHQAAQGSKPADTILLTRRLILEPLVAAHAAALYPTGLQTALLPMPIISKMTIATNIAIATRK